MNTQNMPQGNEGEEPSAEEIMAALFANMVIQNTNMALMFLGKVPHPQTGQPIHDLESAQMFIDQLEMLAYKTRGNLGKEEEQLLKQSLMSLRMAFVEEARKAGFAPPEQLVTPDSSSSILGGASAPQIQTASAAPTQGSTTTSAPVTPPTPQAPQAPAQPPQAPAAAAADEESRKRFTKKY